MYASNSTFGFRSRGGGANFRGVLLDDLWEIRCGWRRATSMRVVRLVLTNAWFVWSVPWDIQQHGGGRLYRRGNVFELGVRVTEFLCSPSQPKLTDMSFKATNDVIFPSDTSLENYKTISSRSIIH